MTFTGCLLAMGSSRRATLILESGQLGRKRLRPRAAQPTPPPPDRAPSLSRGPAQTLMPAAAQPPMPEGLRLWPALPAPPSLSAGSAVSGTEGDADSG